MTDTQEDYDLFCKFLSTYGITSVNVETGKFDEDQTQPPRDELQVYQSFWKTIKQEAEELTQAKENYRKAQLARTDYETAMKKARETLDGNSVVLAFSDTSTVQVSVSVSQDDVAALFVGQSSTVTISDAGTFEGIVTETNEKPGKPKESSNENQQNVATETNETKQMGGMDDEKETETNR